MRLGRVIPEVTLPSGCSNIPGGGEEAAAPAAVSTVTRLVSTVCYHSPHLLAPMVAGLAPYTAAPHAEVPPSIRLVSLISTISSIYLSTHYTYSGDQHRDGCRPVREGKQ